MKGFAYHVDVQGGNAQLIAVLLLLVRITHHDEGDPVVRERERERKVKEG